MAKYNFHLNSDRSIEGIYNDQNNSVILSSTHRNQRNVSNLIGNLSNLLNVEQNKGSVNISLNGTPFIKVDTKKGTVENTNELTSFETRLFARAEKPEALPFANV